MAVDRGAQPQTGRVISAPLISTGRDAPVRGARRAVVVL